jgi:CDP-glycerol glycerophosphotransferase
MVYSLVYNWVIRSVFDLGIKDVNFSFKLFRRELLSAAGARWGTGGYGELALTWPAFLAAGRVAALPAVSYVRHCPPNAEPPWGSPLDALDHYEAILSRTDLDPAKRELVLGELARHGLMLLDEAAEKDRRALFARLARAYQEHVSGPPRGQWRRVLQSGSYNALRAFDAARAGRRTVARSRRSLERPARRVAGRARRWSLERHYAAERRRPIDPDLAVYAAYWYRGYSCNPRAIYEMARELVPAARGVWVVGPDRVDSLPAGVEHVVAGTPEYYTAIARARYLVNNVNFPNHLVKREGSVHVQTHHGTPLKVMGLDQRHAPVSGQKMDFEALARRCARWDYSVSSNPFSTLIWERTYPFRYETLEVGYPRNDALANATPEDALRVREELGIEPGRTAVLYAPTHREWQRRFESPLDLAAVARGLGPDHVVLARVHYFYEADPVLGELHRAGRILDVSAHPSIEELCIASDVLVTDYSSLMFDYGVLDRPIIIYAPDWEVYKALRGVYFDLMAEPPGIVTARQGELIATLRSGDDDPEARAAFRARFCPLDDGRAAERVVRRVWFGERAVAAPQPAALR